MQHSSKFYGVIQTVLFCMYAAAVFFGPGRPLLFTGKILRPIGALVCLAGLVLLFAAIRRLGQAIQVAPAPKQDATLVTTGIYRWFRHPIYTAIVMIVIGLFLRTPTIFVGGATAIVIGFLAVKVRLEETLLLAHYPEYAEYKRRSWGLVPWPR